ncbi:MAG: cytochrome c oxidase accessory protein CcoG [Alphaproteobacteria bacterium]
MPHIEILPEAPPPVDTDKVGLMGLFEARKSIYPAKVDGTFRRTKWAVMALLLGIYYLMPWVRWERGVGAPNQAILVDVMERKFYFFFIEVWPQEVFYFTGLLLLGALGLFFATTLFGRVWCGYACPQTVWTDLFLHVERFFEGDRNAQVKLNNAPWSFNKLWRKSAKHVSWILIGLATGGAWVFYFHDAPTLWSNMLHGQFDFIPTFWMVFLTFSTYVMAGFAREQVCTYMCPYARFQGAMFDEESMLVTYDSQRGEPRGKGASHGDCVDCGRCIAVCPTGIDIRDGQQYRCINCGLCVDACATVMTKLGKPAGLIRYNTLNNTIPANIGWWGTWKAGRFVRPRTVIYASIMAVVSVTMLYSLTHRPLVTLSMLHQRNPLFVNLSNHDIRNTYTVRVGNKTWQPATYTLTSTLPLHLRTADVQPHSNGALSLTINPGKVAEFTVFATVSPTVFAQSHTPVTFTLSGTGGTETYTTVFIAPERE